VAVALTACCIPREVGKFGLWVSDLTPTVYSSVAMHRLPREAVFSILEK
jgi:hypothetical protein